MRFDNYQAMNALDASTNETSGPIEAAFMLYASAQAITTSTAVGVLKFQASNDNSSPMNGDRVSHWSDISQSVAISGAGTYLIPKFDSCYQYLRLVYTSTSGAGAITVNAKLTGF